MQTTGFYPDAGVSITDMWKTAGILLLFVHTFSSSFSLVHFAWKEILHSLILSKAEVQWDGINKINPEYFITGSVSTTVPQTPSSGVIEVQSSTNTARRWLQALWSEKKTRKFSVLDGRH